MATTFLPNKNLGYPAIGDTGWGTTADTTFTNADVAFGGNQQFNLGAASGTIPVSASSYNGTYPANTASYIPLTWTLTGALSANIILQLPAGVGGQWIVTNQCSLGSFSITVTASGGTTSAVLSAGNQIVYSDGLGHIYSVSSGAAGVTTLAGLSDVSVSGQSNGQVLTWNTTANKWVNANATAGTLAGDTDVAIFSPSNNQVLTYSSAIGKWVNQTPGGTSTYLPAAAVFNGSFSGAQSISATTFTTLNFAGASPSWGTWNGSSMSLSAAGTYNVSVSLSVNVAYASNAIGDFIGAIALNGSGMAAQEILGFLGTSYNFIVNLSTNLTCSNGNTISAQVYVFNPSGLFSSASTASNFYNIQIVKLV